MPPHIGEVTQDAAPDEPADPRLHARLSAGAGAVLGIVVALLLALLPGGAVHAARLQSGFSAASADHHLAPADRASEALRSLHKTKRPDPRRADFDGGLASLSQPSQPGRIAPAAPLRATQAPAQRPARWPATAQARAPPLA